MEEYLARSASGQASRRPLVTLSRLLLKNRSHRGYDPRFIVREDQLRRIIGVNTRIPSARNQQVLRFRPVLADEAPGVLAEIRLGGALPELHLPLPGTGPNAFIIVCSTVPEDRYVDIDLGISVQSMLLQAAEIGLNGICIGAFDKERIRQKFHLESEPLLILAIGKGIEKIELVEISENDDHRYFRKDGIHYVPKVRVGRSDYRVSRILRRPLPPPSGRPAEQRRFLVVGERGVGFRGRINAPETSSESFPPCC